jgi:CheY-like chemotaxis protein
MVHGLAAQLGGGLRIDSAPGQGTRIELCLPISASAAGSEEAQADHAPALRGLGTVLLVDDEELVRMSTADMLAMFGYHVAEAGSAEEAVRLVRGGLRPDLLVTDHLMPGMNGAELARKLRADRPELPVLIVSGYAEAEGVAQDLQRLTKPFRNDELAASLSALLAPLKNA